MKGAGCVGYWPWRIPTPWRSEVRGALRRGDKEALKRLSGEVSLADQSAHSMWLAGAVVKDYGGPEGKARAVALLERAYASHPTDFGLVSLLARALYTSDPPRTNEALRYYTVAVALRPESPWVWAGLGQVLRDARRLEESAAAHRKAIELKPDFAAAHTNLGSTLSDQKQLDAALAAHRKAVELDPDAPDAHNSLGVALEALGKRDDAIAAYRKAAELKPDFASAHSNLGGLLREQGEYDEAETECLTAIKHDESLVSAHYHLGNVRLSQKKYDEAAAAYRRAVELEPDYAKGHAGLGIALRMLKQHAPAVAELDLAIRYDPNDYKSHRNRAASLNDLGYLDEAIAGNREANRLDPSSALGQYNLGNALREKGALDDAIYCYRVAIRLQPDYAEAYWNLGQTLKRKGEFRDALATLRRADLVGSRQPNWAPGRAPLIREAERLVELDRRLPAVLKGEQAPADANEQVELAICLSYKGQKLAAAQLFKQAFTGQKSASTVNGMHAAGAAALAGCGQGIGAADLTEADRARWRRQALNWLRSTAAVWTKQLDSENPQTRARSLRTLRLLRYQVEFAGVRDSAGLAKLPETESISWRQFWDEVDGILARADAAPVTPPK